MSGYYDVNECMRSAINSTFTFLLLCVPFWYFDSPLAPAEVSGGFTRSLSAKLPSSRSKRNTSSNCRTHSSSARRISYTRIADVTTAAKQNPEKETKYNGNRDHSSSGASSCSSSRSAASLSQAISLSHVSSGSAFYSKVVAQQVGTFRKPVTRK